MADAEPPTGAPERPTPRVTTPLLAIGIVALLGGLVLRVVAPSPMWLDEALSVRIASLPFTDMVEALRHDGHPALYYLLLGWWTDLFGHSDLAARSLSAVASLATVPVVWAIGRRRSVPLGAVAALLALTSPYLLRYGTEARMYALVALLVAAGWWAVERALERPDPRRLAVVALLTAALVHTHYWSFWVIAAACLVLAGWARVDPNRRPAAVRVVAAIAAGGATFVVWLGVFLDQLGSTGTPWASRARPAEIAMETVQALGGGSRFEGETLGILLVVLAVVGLLGHPRSDGVELRFASGPMTGAAAMLAGTLAIGGVVAFATAGAFEGRYAAVVVPFALLLVARGVVLLPRSWAAATLALLVVAGLVIGADEARRDRTQAGDVAAAIDAGIQPGDIVAFCPDQVGPATRHELTTQVTAVAYPRGDGTLVDWSDYTDVIAATPPEQVAERIETAAAGHDVWFVAGLGYHGLGNRCEALLDLMRAGRRARPIVAPSDAFEHMLLIRFEAR